MMKTIGILTTYFASNFGAALQPYAMKKTLEQLGFDVEVIRYQQKAVWRHYNPFNLLNVRRCFRKNPISTIIALLWEYPLKCIKELKFRKFIRTYITMNGGFEKEWSKEKDFYFIGSDQLWRPQNTGGSFDDVYFGQFRVKAGAKKISYAVSGEAIDYNERNVKYLKENLKNFDFISVRERKLAEELMLHTGVDDIHVTVDPTLLCNPKIFDDVKQKHPCPGKKFILFYQIRNSLLFLPKLYKYARSMNAELVVLSSYVDFRIKLFSIRNRHVLYFPDACEDLFLGSIKNAEVVFTPSFHGNVFAILNRKNVYDLVLDDGHDTRANELLNNLGIKDHFLRVEDEIQLSSINYDDVEKKLSAMRNKSMMFVRNALGV
ncbi:MAG: polysaccharide pyruvyl transferase family protein [Fibrobacter sp.]|nr:polysaccharide pyruvyl transferase family protein [Fibrobacter sp.]